MLKRPLSFDIQHRSIKAGRDNLGILTGPASGFSWWASKQPYLDIAVSFLLGF
jgi:hypothetical protein